MPLSRRSAVTAVTAWAAIAATGSLQPHAAHAQPADPRMAERGLGKDGVKVVVQEWFSLTCSHCAEFQKSTFPQVRKDLIDTGRIHYVWRDYPLDQVALMAAMVARALPAERYEPFISTLLATQDRWAFARGVNSTQELAKIAALAGMPRATFDATIADAGLKQAILAAQEDAEKRLSISSTPSFIINDRMISGAMGYPAFLQAVDAAAA